MAKGFLFRGGPLPQALTLPGTIESTNWEASGISGVVKNDVVFGGITTIQQEEELGFNFQNQLRGNDFVNLPPQIFTFSSLSTTGPITITKETGQGSFNGGFIGARMYILLDGGGQAQYVVSGVTDQDTITAYYQEMGSDGPLNSLTKQFGGQNSQVFINLADLNGTPDPTIQYLRVGNYEEQTQTTYAPAGFYKGGSLGTYFSIPTNAVSITGFEEFPNISQVFENRGDRHYALIFDNKDAYVANASGLRKIAKIENGNTFINTNQTYGEETWSQAGGDLQFITPFAIEDNATNRVTPAEWVQGLQFINLQGYTEVTLAVAIGPASISSDGSTRGIILTYNIEAPLPGGFEDSDFIVVELDMDETTIGDAADIETDWAKIKYYEVLDTNEIRFFATANGVVDIPARVKVIK
jgi:hypothetical protein